MNLQTNVFLIRIREFLVVCHAIISTALFLLMIFHEIALDYCYMTFFSQKQIKTYSHFWHQLSVLTIMYQCKDDRFVWISFLFRKSESFILEFLES